MNKRKLPKLITISKFVFLAIMLALFITGEHFKRRGGHPLWYWIALAAVISMGIALLIAGFLIAKKPKE